MSRADQPPISSEPPHIQLVPMPQLAEALARHDNWTGTANAAARRRAQTRLNTRAYRRRKAQLVQESTAESSSTALATHPTASSTTCGSTAGTLTTSELESSVPFWDDMHQSVLAIPASQTHKLYNPRAPLLQTTPSSSSNSPPPNSASSTKPNTQIIFPLSPDHLITLLQFNAVRALSVNRTFISGILTTALDCHIEVTHTVPFPDPSRISQIPPSLLPTMLQQTVPHPDWIDMFPLPAGRDALIRASIAGDFDEDELWADCIGGLYEGYPDDEMHRRGLIAWSPPWDVSGWEMSEGFAQKWGRKLFGTVLGEMLDATNRWRRERGEERIVMGNVEEVV